MNALLYSPPKALVALQSRVAALYPGYTLGHMPVHAMAAGSGTGEDDEDGEGLCLSPFVGNAVMPGDAAGNWHLDADPDGLPVDSAWVRHYGWYVNREVRGKFVEEIGMSSRGVVG